MSPRKAWNSTLSAPKKPLKRTPFKPRKALTTGFINKRSLLRARSISDTSVAKDEIQDVVRDIVILRDGGCILRNIYGIPACNGHAKDGHLILQADHLVTRANSATYDDTRLIVCLCKGHHGGFKKHNKEQYDALLRTLLPKARVVLWDAAERDSWKATRKYTSDWKMSLIVLKKELKDIRDAKGLTNI